MKKLFGKQELLSPLGLLLALTMVMTMPMTAFATTSAPELSSVQVGSDDAIDTDGLTSGGSDRSDRDDSAHALLIAMGQGEWCDYELAVVGLDTSTDIEFTFDAEVATYAVTESGGQAGNEETAGDETVTVNGLDGSKVYVIGFEDDTGTTKVGVYAAARVNVTLTGAGDDDEVTVEYSDTKNQANAGSVTLDKNEAETREFLDFGSGTNGDKVTVTVASSGTTATVKLDGATKTLDGDGKFSFHMTESAVYNVTVAFGADDGDDDDEPDDTTTSSSSSSSRSSGGGSSGGGGSTALVPPTSANVNPDGTVNSTTVTNDLKKAIANSPGGSAVVLIKNGDSISQSALQSLANAAAAAGKEAVLHADTVGLDGVIQGRLYIDPAQLSNNSGGLKLGVSTQGARPTARKQSFEKHFANKVAVISCAQQGSFGAKLKIAAKVEIPGDGKNLVFYSYDAKTNQYRKIDTEYRIDANGFIHFETALGGDIIISGGPLTRK